MIKLNLGCGGFPLKGFINMDSRSDLEEIFIKRHQNEGIPLYIIKQWKWQDGLKDFETGSIEAITESHSLMYLKVEEYYAALLECYRVLKFGGIFRITEDNCETSNCAEYGLPWGNPASITGPSMMRKELEKFKFTIYDIEENKSFFIDNSLIQQFHGTPPRVFHIESIKQLKGN